MTPRLALRSSHERVLESLYERHAAEVYRYALMMLGSASDAEDVTQTTFLNAYRALLAGEKPRATGRWLHKIAHNLCLQHFRQAARRPHQVELDQAPAGTAPDDDGVRAEDLQRALAQIPDSQRAALVMRELEGRPIDEIANLLETSTSAVETLLFRARRALREQLESALSCAEAERAISLQLDGQLSAAQRGALRAHLRQCEDCARLARSLRAQRGAVRALAAIPLPAALAWSKFASSPGISGVAAAGTAAASGGSATGTGWLAGSVATKLTGAALAATLATGASYEAVVHHPWTGDHRASGHRLAASAGHEAGSGVASPAGASVTGSAPSARQSGLGGSPQTRAPRRGHSAVASLALGRGTRRAGNGLLRSTPSTGATVFTIPGKSASAPGQLNRPGAAGRGAGAQASHPARGSLTSRGAHGSAHHNAQGTARPAGHGKRPAAGSHGQGQHGSGSHTSSHGPATPNPQPAKTPNPASSPKHTGQHGSATTATTTTSTTPAARGHHARSSAGTGII